MLPQKRIKHNIYLLKNNLKNKEKIKRYLSPTIIERKNISFKNPIKKSLSGSLLLENNIKEENIGKNPIKIKYKGISTYVSRKEFYKMKNIDISQLKAYKNEKNEVIKQKKLFLEKANSIYNTNIIDSISKKKEIEYRKGITNIQNELRNKKDINKEQMSNFYYNIINIIKTISNQCNYEINKRIKDTNKRINSDINQVNKLQEKELDKKLEKLNYIMVKLKELITKMENINKDYKKIKNNIDIYIKENTILKKKIKIQNKKNKKLILTIKSKENKINDIEKVLNKYWNYNLKKNEEKNNIQIYKKIKINKKNNIIREKSNPIINNKLIYYNNTNNSINNNQTNYSTNNINLLTKRNKNNQINLDSSNSFKNIISNSFIIYNTKNKEEENIQLDFKEKKLINNLEKNLEYWKNKLNLMKKKLNEEMPQNTFYDLIINIINKLKKEESDSVIYNIDNKLLTDNMRIFPYQSRIFRQIFMGRLFNDKNLYPIFISERKNSDFIFNKNIFNATKINKK